MQYRKKPTPFNLGRRYFRNTGTMDGMPFGSGAAQEDFVSGWYHEYQRTSEWAVEFLEVPQEPEPAVPEPMLEAA